MAAGSSEARLFTMFQQGSVPKNIVDLTVMNLSNSATAYRPTRTLPCRYYSTHGYCFYGDQCQFVHAKPSENRAGKDCKQEQKSLVSKLNLHFGLYPGYNQRQS